MKTISKYFTPRKLSVDEKVLLRTPVLTRQVARRSLGRLAFSKVPRLDDNGTIPRAKRREMARLAVKNAIKHHGLGGAQ